MKKSLIYLIIILILNSGCTTIVTAPIDIATSVVSGTIDIAGSAIGAVVPDGEDDED